MKPESVDKTRVKRKNLLRLQIIGHHHLEPGNIILEGSWLPQEGVVRSSSGSEKLVNSPRGTMMLQQQPHQDWQPGISFLRDSKKGRYPTDEGRSWSYALWHANLAP